MKTLKCFPVKPSALFVIGCFAVVLCALYANTLHAPFILDDKDNIVENRHIRLESLSVQGVLDAALRSPRIWRPAANLSFALNYYLGGYRVWGYHAVNILIHVMTAIAVFLLFRVTLAQSKTKDTDLIAFWAALIWAVHPIQTQAVTYIVQRMTSMTALFFIVSLYCYAKGRSNWKGGERRYGYFMGCAAAGLLAMATKEIAATLPFFILLYEWFFFQGLSRSWFKKNIVPVLMVVGVFIALAFLYLGESPLDRILSLYAKRDFTPTERLLTQARVVVFYVTLLLLPLPSRLNLDHDISISTGLWTPATTVFSICGITAALVFAVMIARKKKIYAFAIFWFFGNLAIESSVIGLELIFEHRLYLPSIFVCLAVVVWLFRVVKSVRAVSAILLIMTGLLSFWTIQRNAVWRDEIRLWQDSAAKSPHKVRPAYNLGIALAEQGRTSEAITQFKKALAINPELASVHTNLGIALFDSGDFDGAISHYKQALAIAPGFYFAHLNLGQTYAAVGKNAQAAVHYKKALKKKPRAVSALNSMGNLLLRTGNVKAAADYYANAIRIDPKFGPAYNGLGVSLIRIGRTNAAREMLKKALELNPGDATALENLKYLSSKP